MAADHEEQRATGLPHLELSLECPKEIRPAATQASRVQFRVTYTPRGNDGDASSTSVTFHKFARYLEATLSRLVDGKWEQCQSDEDNSGYMIVDAPPELVNVSQHEKFLSLHEGESAIMHDRPFTFLLYEDAVDEAKVGDRFRLQYMGGEVEWWDWGDSEAHKNTEVYLPCWANGPVIDPPTPETDSNLCPVTNNGGRPQLVVGPSEPVEFVIV